MSGRRQRGNNKATKGSYPKSRQKKDVLMLNTTMERYLGLEETKTTVLQNDHIKIEETSHIVVVDVEEKELQSQDTSPLSNIRLSPRKHASTLSRCAAVTTKENVNTPHRIRLCEDEPKMVQSLALTLNPYKRTRRRLNAALDEQTTTRTADSVNINHCNNIKTKPSLDIIVNGECGQDVFSDKKLLNGDADIEVKCIQNGDYKHDTSALITNLQDEDLKDIIPAAINGAAKKNGFIEPPQMKDIKALGTKLLQDNKLVNGLCNGTANGSMVQPGKGKSKTVANGHAVNGNRKLTEFFPVRRSVRKTKKEVLEERNRALELAILEEREDGLEVAEFEGKGRGVVAARSFRRGEFVVEYSGELVSIQEAKDRESRYAQDSNKGCYMYYFKHNNQQYCIDATAESGRVGRLVNHSRGGNLSTKVLFVHHRPHLVLLASQDIIAGEEVMYDYGDRSKESLQAHPWLAF